METGQGPTLDIIIQIHFSAFMASFLFSLVLVAVNLGEIITIIVPLINENASPDKQIENAGDKDNMLCGHGAETAAVSHSLISSLTLIFYFIMQKIILNYIQGHLSQLIHF